MTANKSDDRFEKDRWLGAKTFDDRFETQWKGGLTPDDRYFQTAEKATKIVVQVFLMILVVLWKIFKMLIGVANRMGK